MRTVIATSDPAATAAAIAISATDGANGAVGRSFLARTEPGGAIDVSQGASWLLYSRVCGSGRISACSCRFCGSLGRFTVYDCVAMAGMPSCVICEGQGGQLVRRSDHVCRRILLRNAFHPLPEEGVMLPTLGCGPDDAHALLFSGTEVAKHVLLMAKQVDVEAGHVRSGCLPVELA